MPRPVLPVVDVPKPKMCGASAEAVHTIRHQLPHIGCDVKIPGAFQPISKTKNISYFSLEVRDRESSRCVVPVLNLLMYYCVSATLQVVWIRCCSVSLTSDGISTLRLCSCHPRCGALHAVVRVWHALEWWWLALCCSRVICHQFPAQLFSLQCTCALANSNPEPSEDALFQRLIRGASYEE